VNCGTPLWSAINPGRNIPWAKIADYGWVYRPEAEKHRKKTKNERVLARLEEIAANQDGYEPVRGACRRYALSTYIKKKYRGRINGFLCDELHEYKNASGQGDAMGELFGVSRLFVGMTATLTVPSLGQGMGCSIFMASKVPRMSRALTVSPSFTLRARILPGIRALMSMISTS